MHRILVRFYKIRLKLILFNLINSWIFFMYPLRRMFGKCGNINLSKHTKRIMYRPYYVIYQLKWNFCLSKKQLSRSYFQFLQNDTKKIYDKKTSHKIYLKLINTCWKLSWNKIKQNNVFQTRPENHIMLNIKIDFLISEICISLFIIISLTKIHPWNKWKVESFFFFCKRKLKKVLFIKS